MTRPNMGTVPNVIHDTIKILEKMIERKIKEIHNLRKQLSTQQEQCKQQVAQIIELSDRIKFIEETEGVNAADVIHLDLDESEISTSHIARDPSHEFVPHEQIF